MCIGAIVGTGEVKKRRCPNHRKFTYGRSSQSVTLHGRSAKFAYGKYFFDLVLLTYA